jgi:hypothetical protein
MFITAELLIEYAIRVGTNDIMLDPTILDDLFKIDKLLNEGMNLTPSDSEDEVHEKLIMDEFQAKLLAVPRRPGETPFSDIFSNSMPSVAAIKTYLSKASISITHGFPRQPNDLPTISITLGSEEEEPYLGSKFDYMPPEGGNSEAIGSDMSCQYHLSIITTNYDEMIIWYHLIKYSLWRYRHAIEAYGLKEQSFTWMDVEPAQEYLQAGLFVYQRTCILRGVREEHINVKSGGYSSITSTLDLASEGDIGYSSEQPITL